MTPRFVSEAGLRRRFAEGDYLNRALAGEFGCCLTRTKRARSRDEPPGTQSVAASYVNESLHCIFLVHFYLRPDGTIGGSGKPDPKWLFVDGVVYVAAKQREPSDSLGFGTTCEATRTVESQL